MMKTRCKNFLRWGSLTAISLLRTTVAHAQDVDPRAVPIAQKLYEDGVALLDAKQFAEACPKLEQVTKLIPKGIGGHEALGDCYLGVGRLASAWGQYVQLEALAQAVGDKETVAKAHMEAEKLRPKLATVTITVPKAMQDISGLSVTWDGLAQEQGSWGTPIPIDTGKHLIEVKAPTRQTWNREVVVVADGVMLEEIVPILKMTPIVSQKSKVVQVPSTLPPTWRRPVGGIVLGLGVAGLGIGSVFGGLAWSRRNASNAEGGCDKNNYCEPNGVDLRKEAVEFAHAADVALPLGLVFTGVGAVLFATAPKQQTDSAPNTSLQLMMGPSGIGLRGVW